MEHETQAVIEEPVDGSNYFRAGIVKDILRVGTSGAATAALGFLTSVLLTRSLGPAMFGLFSLYMVVVKVISTVVSTSSDLPLIRFASADYAKGDTAEAESMLKTGLIIKLSIVTLLLIGGLLFSGPIAVHLFKKPEYTDSIWFAAIGIFGVSMWLYVLATFQARRSFTRYSLYSFFPNAIIVTLTVLLIITGRLTLTLAMTVYVSVYALSTVVGVLMMPRSIFYAKTAGMALYSKVIHFGKWTTVSSMAAIGCLYLDILMLSYFTDSATVGFYSAAFTLSSAVDLIGFTLFKVLLPVTSELNTPREYRGHLKSVCGYFAIIALCCVLVLFIAKPLVILLYTDTFAPSVPLFKILLVSSITYMSVTLFGMVFYTMDKPHVIAFIDIAALIVAFIGNYVFIPLYGATGAAWTTLFARGMAAVLTFLCLYIYVLRERSA